MKNNIILCLPILICIILLVSPSCKKEKSSTNTGNNSNNKRPVANAGVNQTVSIDSILLDGSASYDPDGTITEWRWIKISGFGSYNMSSEIVPKPVIKNITPGVYEFELTVKDNLGSTAKDTVQIQVSIPNRPPIARAGTDVTLTLPQNAFTLNGTGSTDPDNNITTINWSKILGPTFTIANPNAAQTLITNLVAGVYQFELKVTDAGNLFSKDTVQITVLPEPGCNVGTRPLINAQLIQIGSLGRERQAMAVASAGNKIVFAGGMSGAESAFVDIYDLTNQTWSTSSLSLPRSGISAVANGNKIFFAGGGYWYGDYLSNVDIYDVATNTWTVTALSEPKTSIAAAAIGNKVMFAGGYKISGDEYPNNIVSTVDIYNLSTNSWSTAQLSEARGDITAVTVNNKVYFAGGWTGATNSNRIDIYDNASNTWSISSLNFVANPRSACTAAEKIYWSGAGCNIEVRNINTGTSISESLSRPDADYSVIKDGKIIFIHSGNTKFDIYEIATNSWSVGVLSEPIPLGSSIIAVNNKIYIAGGKPVSINLYTAAVYRLEF